MGALVGLVLGALFGGRGGLFFFFLGLLGGCAIALVRTVYLGIYYDETLETHPASTGRVIRRRIVFSAMYFLLLNPLVKYLDPHEWNNPYTYDDWGGPKSTTINRDGQAIVLPTIISYKKAKGHYYGLRMPIDSYKCGKRGSIRISNRRLYFILPFEEDVALEFQDKDEFEAELKARISSNVKKLNYALFDEKWNDVRSLYKARDDSDCVITRFR